MKDETDKTIHPVVAAIYDDLKARVAAERAKQPNESRWHVMDYVRIDGRKITCMIYLIKNGEDIEEQFEYYDYRYFHVKKGADKI